ncbi:MAG: helix-turn-helix domain-containing protein [Saprospiraceae bacterium]
MQKDKYIKKLEGYMVVHKPHLEPELTLAQLSKQIKIPTHYLSQVINEKLACNFLDFVNRYRIEDAKQKLTDAKYSHYTIISIAYEAGFNAKSTFYAAFKKQTGMTPSQYRKQAKIVNV